MFLMDVPNVFNECSIKEINRYEKKYRLLSKRMSNIYLKVTIDKN